MLLKSEIPPNTRPTEPVINIIQHDREFSKEYIDNVLNDYPKMGNYVKFHKKVFGKQTYCWNGEYRYWVWEFDKWRVYVSNHMGISLEVEPDLSLPETIEIIRKYWAALGLQP